MMTLCAQYTDNMKKRTLAQNGTSPNIHTFVEEISDFTEDQYKAVLARIKPKRPRGKKVFSTDKGAKR